MTDEELRQEFQEMRAQFRNIETQFRNIDELFRNIDAKFDGTPGYIAEFRSEIIQSLEVIQHSLHFQGATLSALTKQAMDSGSNSSWMLREIGNLKRRVEKLESAA
jgi:hypothetical protein